ncbi:MAG: hypothetical protein O2904_01645 [bacterium]|nr:hypothetical protein [bacterium]
MQKILSTPWAAVSLGIIGLIAGYTFVVVSHNEAFTASECLANRQHVAIEKEISNVL